MDYNIGSRIKMLRKQHGVTMDELAKFLNISTPNISRYEQGRYNPSSDTIIALSQFFNVSADWLLTGFTSSGIELSNDEIKLIKTYRNMPEIKKSRLLGYIDGLTLTNIESSSSETDDYFVEDGVHDYLHINEHKYKTVLCGYISAGDGIDAFDNREIVSTPIPCDFALRINGDSMKPDFKDKSIIYMKQTDIIERPGQLLAVQIDDIIPQAYFKKVYAEDDKIRLVSLNKNYADKVVAAGDVRVLGKLAE